MFPVIVPPLLFLLLSSKTAENSRIPRECLAVFSGGGGSCCLLIEAAKAACIGAGKHAERRVQWRREHDRIVAAEHAAEAKGRDAGKIDPLALVGALREAMPEDAIYVEETITHAGILQQHLPWSEPRSFFRAGGGLGQGLGTALGVKLGAPKRPVAALIGDGSFLYNLVVQALRAAKGQRPADPDRRLQQRPISCDASGRPAPLPRRCRAKGRHVARRDDRRSRLRRVRQALRLRRAKDRGPAELPGAIRTAMRAVEDGKTAILNVALSR